MPFGGSEKSLLEKTSASTELASDVGYLPLLSEPLAQNARNEPAASASVRAPAIIFNLDLRPSSGVRVTVGLNKLFEWLTTLLVKNFTSFQV